MCFTPALLVVSIALLFFATAGLSKAADTASPKKNAVDVQFNGTKTADSIRGTFTNDGKLVFLRRCVD